MVSSADRKRTAGWNLYNPWRALEDARMSDQCDYECWYGCHNWNVAADEHETGEEAIGITLVVH